AAPTAPSTTAPASTAATPLRVRFFAAAGLVSFQLRSASSAPAAIAASVPAKADNRTLCVLTSVRRPRAAGLGASDTLAQAGAAGQTFTHELHREDVMLSALISVLVT